MVSNGFSINLSVSGVQSSISGLQKFNKALAQVGLEGKKNLAPFQLLGRELTKFTDLTGIRKLSGGLRSLTADLIGVSKATSGIGSLFGAGAVTAAIKIANATASAANSTSQQAKALGLSYTGLQQLQNVASAGGTSLTLDAVPGAVAGVDDALRSAVIGNGAALQKFQQLLPGQKLYSIGANGARNANQLSPSQIETLIKNINKQNLSGTQKKALEGIVGASGFDPLIQLSNADLNKAINKGNSMSTDSEADAKAAHDLVVSTNILSKDFDTLQKSIMPPLEKSLTNFYNFLDKIVNLGLHHPEVSTAVEGGAGVGAATYLGIKGIQLAKGVRNVFKALSTDASKVATQAKSVVSPVVESAEIEAKSAIPAIAKKAPFAIGTIGGVGKYVIPFVDIAALGAMGVDTVKQMMITPEQYKEQMYSQYGNFKTTGASTNSASMKSKSNEIKSAVGYFMKNGYTKAQSEGLVTNLFDESSLNPNAIGDNGNAHGIAQWHADRIKQIKDGTGIDVTNANFSDQLKAVLWELHHSESAANQGLSTATTAAQAAARVSLGYERPAAGFVAAQNRANDSQGIANIVDGQIDVTVTLKNDGNHKAVATTKGRNLKPAKVVMPLPKIA